ncbi:MAG: hypothetical protein KF788_08890 [Piscinibacter sp.]|nr:hypothetical protein [Piscinibacter sp.]
MTLSDRIRHRIRRIALIAAALAAAALGVLNHAQAARIPLGALTTLNLSTHLDPMFVELYEMRELVSTPSYVASTPRLTINSSGNLGHRTTPSPWASSLPAFDVGSLSGLASDSSFVYLVGNGYYDGTNWRAKSTAASSQIALGSGTVQFYRAASVAAGAAQTVVESARIDASGNLLVTGGGTLGYGTGSGGTVTQATSKSTAVTLNKPTGQVTLNAAALAAGATVGFQLNSTAISAGDIVLVQTVSGMSNAQNYTVNVGNSISGAASIYLTNRSGGSLSEAIVLSFSVVKVATS